MGKTVGMAYEKRRTTIEELQRLLPPSDQEWAGVDYTIQQAIKELRDRDELIAALREFRASAVVLSREYLEAFKDYSSDSTIQGWDKARWIRALAAADTVDALLAKHAKVTA